MQIPETDETLIRAFSLFCAMCLNPKDGQEAMAVADGFNEYIDPLADEGEFTFTLEENQ